MLQSCLTLLNPMGCSPPASSVHGTLQAGTREWVSMPSSKGSTWPRGRTHISYISCIRQAGSLQSLVPPGNPWIILLVQIFISIPIFHPFSSLAINFSFHLGSSSLWGKQEKNLPSGGITVTSLQVDIFFFLRGLGSVAFLYSLLQGKGKNHLLFTSVRAHAWQRILINFHDYDRIEGNYLLEILGLVAR